MRYFIICAMALASYAMMPNQSQGQVVAQYYGAYPYYYNYYGSTYPGLYRQRLNYYNYYPYTGSYYSPYRTYWRGRPYYNSLRHRYYHRYYNYRPYSGWGVYYNSPGFGLRFSF